MSRKPRELYVRQQGSGSASATPRFWVYTAGYTATKLSALTQAPLLVLLYLDESDVPSKLHDAPGKLPPTALLTPAAQRLLLGSEDEEIEGFTTTTLSATFILVDLSPLVAESDAVRATSATTSARAILDAEGSTAALGKQLGKPTARLLEKLFSGVEGATLVAYGATAQLALKLLRTGEAEHGIAPGRLERLLLLHVA